MAYVEIEEIVDHLSSEMRRALEQAVNEVDSEVHLDAHELFRAFRRAVRSKCSTWEQVPDQYVRMS